MQRLTTEATLLQQWAAYRHRFPHLPERSRFNRRRWHLRHALNAIRQAVLAVLDVARDRQCAIDSLPVPVLAFPLVPGVAGAGGGRTAGADFGKVPTKKQTIFGDTLHLLVTLGGVIRDCAFTPASASDVAVGAGLLREQADLIVLYALSPSTIRSAIELRAARRGAAGRAAPQPAAAGARRVACRRNAARQALVLADGVAGQQIGDQRAERRHAQAGHGEEGGGGAAGVGGAQNHRISGARSRHPST